MGETHKRGFSHKSYCKGNQALAWEAATAQATVMPTIGLLPRSGCFTKFIRTLDREHEKVEEGAILRWCAMRKGAALI